MSRRTERLASIIRQELAEVILHHLSDPRITGMPSITRVKVSEDLSNADIYLSIMGTPAQQSTTLTALRHSAGLMRTRLSRSLSTRSVPYLKIHLDEELKRELAVMELLDKARREFSDRAENREQPSQDQPAGELDSSDQANPLKQADRQDQSNQSDES